MFFKRLLYSIAVLNILLLAQVNAETAPAQAKLGSTHSVSEAHIEKLEKMHNDAESLILTSNFEEAIEKYNDILILEPDDETAYVNMGNAYMILGNFSKAEMAFANALHINPENKAAQAGVQKINDPDAAPMNEDPLTLSPLEES